VNKSYVNKRLKEVRRAITLIDKSYGEAVTHTASLGTLLHSRYSAALDALDALESALKSALKKKGGL
jgi:hypothetical protein